MSLATKLSDNGPLRLIEGRVKPEWIDYNGHMSEAFYVLATGLATDELMDLIGIGAVYREKHGGTIYTLETHVVYLLEIAVDEAYYVTTYVLKADRKRIHLIHCMYRSDNDDLLATNEQMLLHVDMAGPKAAPFPVGADEKLQALAAVHAKLPRPEQAGRAIELRPAEHP